MEIDKILSKFQEAVHFRNAAQWILIIGVIFILFSLIIGLLIVAVGAIIIIKFWKCPVCGKHLPLREPVEKILHCQSCGTRLQP